MESKKYQIINKCSAVDEMAQQILSDPPSHTINCDRENIYAILLLLTNLSQLVIS